MGHWTPTGIEPTDYDDDDDLYTISYTYMYIMYIHLHDYYLNTETTSRLENLSGLIQRLL